MPVSTSRLCARPNLRETTADSPLGPRASSVAAPLDLLPPLPSASHARSPEEERAQGAGRHRQRGKPGPRETSGGGRTETALLIVGAPVECSERVRGTKGRGRRGMRNDMASGGQARETDGPHMTSRELGPRAYGPSVLPVRIQCEGNFRDLSL